MKNIKRWILTCSVDGIDIDFETILFSESEPGFWTCYDIATANGCDFFTITEFEE